MRGGTPAALQLWVVTMARRRQRPSVGPRICECSAGVYIRRIRRVLHDGSHVNAIIVRCCWGALTLVWFAAAASAKPTLRATDYGTRVGSMVMLLVGFCLVVTEWPPGWLGMRPLPPSAAVELLGVGSRISAARSRFGHAWCSAATGAAVLASRPITSWWHRDRTGSRDTRSTRACSPPQNSWVTVMPYKRGVPTLPWTDAGAEINMLVKYRLSSALLT